MSQYHRADRTREVAHRVRGQRRDQRHGRVALREEDEGEDQGGGLGVDGEVVILQHAADPAAHRGLFRRLLVLARFPRIEPLRNVVLHAVILLIDISTLESAIHSVYTESTTPQAA